jgi:1-acyl-sn-glycerol-3-phosphate acyltransferase
MRLPDLPSPRARAAWPEALPLRAVREAMHVAAVAPALRGTVSVEVYGAERLSEINGPVILAANHSSHLDVPTLLSSLPAQRRRRTVVAAAAGGAVFRSRWRAIGSACLFHALPLETGQDGRATRTDRLIADGWNVLVFPEGSRSPDGFVGKFGTEAAELAIRHGVPVVPVGVRGTYAAMPRGRSWPVPGRPRVSVRYGEALHGAASQPPAELSHRLHSAVHALLAEDQSSWWAVQRGAAAADTTAPAGPPAGSWRRIWQESEAPVAGRSVSQPRIWRS